MSITQVYQGLNFEAQTISSKTWTAIPIGTAATDRLVFVTIYGRNSNPVSSVSVNGVSATHIFTQISPSPFAQVSVWVVPVSTGTTATIAYTFTSSFFHAMAITAVYGANTTPLDANGTNSTNFALTTESSGILLGYHFNLSDPEYPTWTGLTAIDEEYQSGGFGYSFSYAVGSPSASSTTVGASGGTSPCTVIVSLAASGVSANPTAILQINNQSMRVGL